MIRDSGPAWQGRASGPGDAHGLAVLLVAILLAAGTALPQLETGGTAFPQPAIARVATPSAGEAGTPVPTRTASHEGATKSAQVKPRVPTPLNINTANAEALQALPGIGPLLADRIVADREAHGPFRTPEDLLRVPGIGPKRWERIRPLVRLAEEP
jgi:competence protein ComEA